MSRRLWFLSVFLVCCIFPGMLVGALVSMVDCDLGLAFGISTTITQLDSVLFN